MNGEDWREQLGRLKGALRDLDDLPPARRPGDMPRTTAARLEVLNSIKAAHGLQPHQGLAQCLEPRSMARPTDEPLEPLFVWLEIETGRRLMARERPAGCAPLSEVSLLIGGA